MAAHLHVWITDRKSMQALGSIHRSKEAGERQKFGSWKTINNNNRFYSLSPIPPRFDGTLPGNGLPSQWRGTAGIKEKSRKSAAAKWRGSEFPKVCIDDSTLIISPRLTRVSVPEYSKWSDVDVLHIPSSMTHQGREWNDIKRHRLRHQLA